MNLFWLGSKYGPAIQTHLVLCYHRALSRFYQLNIEFRMYLIHVIFQLITDKQPVNPWMKHFKRNYISKKWNQLTSFIHSTSIHLSPSTENDICHTEWLNRIQWIPITIPIMIHIDLRFHKNMSHIKLQLSTREIVNYSIWISIACMWHFESQIF